MSIRARPRGRYLTLLLTRSSGGFAAGASLDVDTPVSGADEPAQPLRRITAPVSAATGKAMRAPGRALIRESYSGHIICQAGFAVGVCGKAQLDQRRSDG
jgi:hypothetical protein